VPSCGAMAHEADRTALVTGVAAGIGAAIARRLLGDGWRVIGVDRTSSAPDGVELVTGDAGDGAVLESAVSRASGRLDGLVCSAGIPPSGPWDSREHWDEVLAVDLSAPYEALRLAMPALAAASGSAVLVGSIVGAGEGSLRSPAYAAAKAGLEGLARSMAVVAAPQGVRVNVVAPGAIDTDFDERLLPDDARVDVPLHRLGSADEVASVIAFLLGAETAYVTGAVWRVDGGRAVLSVADANRLR
jgi:meso-butanediol dehydrogenase / (S,S)-butanediol dehydrogenase / diacetyl reductase